jgi:hypothetical protein
MMFAILFETEPLRVVQQMLPHEEIDKRDENDHHSDRGEKYLVLRVRRGRDEDATDAEEVVRRGSTGYVRMQYLRDDDDVPSLRDPQVSNR